MSNFVPIEEAQAQTPLAQMKELVRVTKEAVSQARDDARELKQLSKMQAHGAALPGLIADFYQIIPTHDNDNDAQRNEVFGLILDMAHMYGYVASESPDPNLDDFRHFSDKRKRVLKTISALRRLTIGYSVERCNYTCLAT